MSARRWAAWLRRCWNCGKAIGARERFCGYCGARQRDPNRARASAAIGPAVLIPIGIRG